MHHGFFVFDFFLLVASVLALAHQMSGQDKKTAMSVFQRIFRRMIVGRCCSVFIAVRLEGVLTLSVQLTPSRIGTLLQECL